MNWPKLFAKRPEREIVAPPEPAASQKPGLVAAPIDCSLFHITHQKAGSQWFRSILEDLFGPAIQAPEYYVRQVWARPLEMGRVYPCVYWGKPEFDTLPLAGGKRTLVIIRDLRDTLVSAYFSLRNTHEVKTEELAHYRHMLNRLNQEEGMLYLLDTWATRSARIQRTWVTSGVHFYRLEDCMKDAVAIVDRMFRESWKLELPMELIEPVVARHSFSRLTGGRKAGEEDLTSHYRKGVAGDWRNYFTPRMTERFKTLYNDLLIETGYEIDPDWSTEPSENHLGAISTVAR